MSLFYSYAHSLINNWEVSRDIASDAFEYIWKNFDRIEKATAKSYLFIYVRNQCYRLSETSGYTLCLC